MTALYLRFAASSDVGRVRRDNQDSGYVGPHLIVIADGVGGAARGDIASSAAVDTLRKLDVPAGEEALSALAATIHLAHDRLAEIVETHAELDGTSTTLTSAVFDGTHLQIGHVGDSRGYLLRDGVLQQLTSDHSLVQSLVDEGRITEEEARVHPHRNLILKAIDSVHEPEPDLFAVPVQPGDRILFCSDGCSGVLENDTMAALLAGDSLEQISTDLVRAALEAGSSDNVTVVVAEVLDGGDAVPEDQAAVRVGAAALTPHLQIPDNTETNNLSDTEIEGLSQATIDPEQIRYAPLPPPKRVWLRRFALLVAVAVVLGALGAGGLAYANTRFYLAPDEATGEVLLYRGVDLDLFGFSLSEVEKRTGYYLDELGDYRDDVSDGRGVKSKSAADTFLKEACTAAVTSSAAEADESFTPFGLGEPKRVPLDRGLTVDCEQGR